MNRYSSYKDSGVSWIGEIPSHWNVIKLNHIFYHNTGKTLNSNLKGNNHPYLTTSNVYNGYFDLSILKEMPFLDDEIERYSVTAGDLLVCEGGDIGRCNIWKENYSICYQNHLHRLRAKIDIKVEYYSFLINHIKSLGIFDNMGKGIAIKGLSAATLGNTRLLLPPLAEQEKIVSYLENKTSKIDAYVADKEKEIELLQELKQKTIADAVTKGLNPDTKMKDSGISWIGEIPGHWEVKRIASLFTGKVQANTDFKYHHAFKFYYGTLVPKNEVGDNEEYRDTYVKYSVLQKDDIMINGLNLNYDFVSQRVAIAPSDGIITSAYVVARPRKGTNALYYNYLFKTMDNMKLFHGMGTGIRLTLSFDEMKKQVVVVPPQDEQQAIVAYIEEKCEKIDKLASELQSEIDYLKEYKQRLIADCVTGQVKVS